MKNNQGTAIILSLVIVSVLFILTSFLVRKVLTNTAMVAKTGEEQESYALAKQGVLYALDKLNTWEGTDPDYDPTDWTPNEVEQGNWSDYSNYSLMVYKDHIPTSGGYTEEEGYTTIESRDLPKKLVTLQAIAENTSPLLNYLRFINSDTDFGNNTFGQTGSESLIQGDAPFCIVGNVTWESGSTNNLILSGSDSKAIIYGKISDGGESSLQINGDPPQSGYHYFFDLDDASYDDPAAFDTGYGRYFSSAHLPSCYDYSGGTPTFYDGSTQATFWPEIKEERFWDSENGTTRLADLAISSDDCGKREINNDFPPYYWWDNWYPSDDTYDYSYSNINGSTVANVYWRQDGSTASYNYTPPGVHLIFSDTQDLDPSTIGTTERLLQVNDDNATELPAEYETSASVSHSPFTSEDVIFCEKDVRVNGVLPRDLTIVSGGNIYIDGNIYTNGHSLGLLAKENVLLNTTHRWVAGYEGGNWDNAANLVGVTDGQAGQAEVDIGENKEQVLNFGGSTSAQIVTTDRIILQGCDYWVGANNTLDFTAQVDLEGENWEELTITFGPSFPISAPENEPLSGSNLTIILETPSTFRNFSRIRLTATGGGTGTEPAGWIEVDAIEVPITNMDRLAIFAENGSWYVIAGNGASENNDQQEPFTLNVALSEQNFEDMSKWDGTDPLLREATWNDITYTYDSGLKSNSPPSLPPSVNLVSLTRK